MEKNGTENEKPLRNFLMKPVKRTSSRKRITRLNKPTRVLTSDTPKKEKEIHVRLTTSNSPHLSQHLLSLSNQHPEPAIAKELTFQRLNLLVEERFLIGLTEPSLEKTLLDLTLDESELRTQLEEDHEPLVEKTIESTELVDEKSELFDLPIIDEEEESDIITLEELEAPHVSFNQFPANIAWRTASAFGLIALMFILPIHALQTVQTVRAARGQMTNEGTVAITTLQEGTLLLGSPEKAADIFGKASRQFDQTMTRLETVGQLIRFSRTGASGEALLEAGENISKTAQRITLGLAAFEMNPERPLLVRLQELHTFAASALTYLSYAESALDRVDPSAFENEQHEIITQAQVQIPLIAQTLREFISLGDFLAQGLGNNETKRYLIVFQNNTELRPTGGFMGSFAEVKIRQGEIVDMTIPGGGTYDLQGSLKTYLKAPEPLRLLTAKWEFQDANWFPDFPTSARQMIDFYTDSGGPSVDGVIAVNATFVADLLTSLGSIDMPEYDRVIDAENFLFEAQKIVENEYDQTLNQPKAFIADLAPKLLERLRSQRGEALITVANRLMRGLFERDIQIYFTDETLQKVALTRGWAGQILQSPLDYLMLVNTNLGGGKTDGVIEENVKVDVDISTDGTVTNTVTITRSHRGIPGGLFTGVNNVTYARLYAPEGSTLVHASGFSPPDRSLFETPNREAKDDDDLLFASANTQIDETTNTTVTKEFGKTVFGNWIQTAPGTTSTTTFIYTLPFKVKPEERKTIRNFLRSTLGLPELSRYNLFVQHQSGVENRRVEVEIHLPESFESVWSSSDLSSVIFDTKTDGTLSVLLEPVSL